MTASQKISNRSANLAARELMAAISFTNEHL
jgi:hypothetical protein